MRKPLFLSFLAAMALIWALSLSARANPGPATAQSPLLKVSSLSDVAALAPEMTVAVNVLIVLATPEVKNTDKRPPVAVSLVIDRSGSMEEAKKLDYAKKAGKTLVKSLGPDDQFAL
ncbi:MAG: hypothetical protein FWG62_05485, partial [Proteobacteria bacterium]|nr:hypothetical protein [Pseudomonadota bacterium]